MPVIQFKKGDLIHAKVNASDNTMGEVTAYNPELKTVKWIATIRSHIRLGSHHSWNLQVRGTNIHLLGGCQECLPYTDKYKVMLEEKEYDRFADLEM